MGAQDDFGLWERELDEPDAHSGHRTALMATAVVTAGCAVLIILGQVLLGVVGLSLSGLILLLWRVGM